MQFHATYVSAGGVGDYFQALFEVVRDGDETPYLLIQRQFEDDDGDVCYIETPDPEYCGHFRLRHVAFSPTRLHVNLDRPRHNVLTVTFELSQAKFRETAPFIDIISGAVDPEPE